VRRRQTFSSVFFSRRGIVAIAASLLLILTVNLWFVYERFTITNEDAIVAEAFAARQDSMRPEQSLAVASTAPEERNQVLTKALSMTLKAPDLTKLGYRLANIRVYSGVAGGKAAELGYRDAQNRLFTLYLRHPSGPPRVDLVERDGMRICVWQDDVLGTVMLGEMSAGEMARIASLAYSGLTL
jgi:anti-sigma factor RsiW